jgi:glutaredoxin-like YruB-family protein
MGRKPKFMITEIQSYSELIQAVEKLPKAYCLLYKKGSEISDCAYKSIAEGMLEKTPVFAADVNTVRDIHPQFQIQSVPTLLIFDKGQLVNINQGCSQSLYYRSLFNEQIYTAKGDEDKSPKQKSVTVYSTPTCTYCTQIKKYFDEKGVKYRDIDVSKDQKAAEAMVKRSGQQGVPQTDIGGTVVIGFDRLKINQLLGLS